MLKNLSTLVLASILFSGVAHARPEYAARLGYLSCTSCHVSPAGGGARTIDGKLWGGRGGPATSWLAKQDLISLDYRAIALFSERPQTAASNGLALMAVTPMANVRMTELKDGAETHLVTGFQLGLLGGATLRESYVLIRLKDPSENALLKDVIFGRFNVPFGIATDEHRTYTRIQNKTGMYDFEMGFLASGDLLPYLHHDFGLTTGLQSGGNFAVQDSPYSLLGNIRLGAPGAPLFLGLSASLHQSGKLARAPYSSALYTGVSLDKLTRGGLSGALLIEYQVARGWNDPTRNSNISKFSSSQALLDAVKDSTSSGASLLADVVLSEKWSAFYKLDRLALDLRFPGDAFVRHGVGAKYFFNSQMSLSARAELAGSNREELSDGSTANTRNDLLLYFITSI